MKHLCLALFLFACSYLPGQSGTELGAFHSRNSFHLEVGGKAWGGSLNYERRYIPYENLRWAWQLGVGRRMDARWIPDPDEESNLLFPISVHLMYGPDHHQLEVSLGTTLKTTTGFSRGNVGYPTIEGGFRMMGTCQIGYRYQPHVYGPVFRVFYSPIYQYLNQHTPGEPSFFHWLGVSLGWALKHAYVG